MTENDLDIAMKELKDTSTVLCFHAELVRSPHNASTEHADPTHYTTYLNSRPPELEVDAITLINQLHQRYPSLRVHIVHLSAALALPLVRAAKASKLPFTVETCFHYLSLSATEIPHGHPEFKCAPPIRDASNREKLWEALLDGTIDCVVSDHSPCVAEVKKIKEGDFMKAFAGISTLGLGLSVLWTECSKRGIGIEKIMDWVSANTARQAGLENRKGQLKVGHDADIIIWDPTAEFKVTKETLHFKNKLTAYDGLLLRGLVQRTYVGGRLAYNSATGFDGLEPAGKLL